MTGSRNGLVKLWKDKKVVKSETCFGEPWSRHNWTLVHYKNDRIFAASDNEEVIELNMDLDVVRKFPGRNTFGILPFTMDANENYLVVGWDVAAKRINDRSGYVDVHSRKKPNTKHQIIMVSSFVQ